MIKKKTEELKRLENEKTAVEKQIHEREEQYQSSRAQRYFKRDNFRQHAANLRKKTRSTSSARSL